MAKSTAMLRRLKLMRHNVRQGQLPSVAQIGAAYAAMVHGNHGDVTWGLLLTLAKQAVGVKVHCLACKRGLVRKFVEGSGWCMVTCTLCQGSMVRVVQKPHGDLPGNMVQGQHMHPQRGTYLTLAQQVAKVLEVA